MHCYVHDDMVVESILLLLFFSLVKFFSIYNVKCDVYSFMLKFRSLLILVVLSDRVTANFVYDTLLWSIYRLTELLIA